MKKKELFKSGLLLLNIDTLIINYSKYNPTRGSSYIDLPDWIKHKKACVNIQNKDNKCGMYSIQCVVHKIVNKDHPERESYYKNLNKEGDKILKWDGVNMPLCNNGIDTLEKITY